MHNGDSLTRQRSVARRTPQGDRGTRSPSSASISLEGDDFGGRSGAAGIELVGGRHVTGGERRERGAEQDLQARAHGARHGTNCIPAWAIVALASAMIFASDARLALAMARARSYSSAW